MKTIFGFGAMVLATTMALSAEVVTTTTRSAGTIREFGPERIIVEDESAPVDYGITGETAFVDETGAPVRVERITRGMPVTVDTIRDGDRLRASRVIVHRTDEPMTKTHAKALSEVWEERAKTAGTPEDRAHARAMRNYYDELEDDIED